MPTQFRVKELLSGSHRVLQISRRGRSDINWRSSGSLVMSGQEVADFRAAFRFDAWKTQHGTEHQAQPAEPALPT